MWDTEREKEIDTREKFETMNAHTYNFEHTQTETTRPTVRHENRETV